MTISTTIISKSYDGDGSNHSFAYNFKIFADADLTVIIRSSTGTETVKTLNTHYVVTGAGVSSGGNVLFKYNTGNASDAHYSVTDQRPQSGETVVIRSELANTQTLDLVANDPFPAETLETNLDKLVRMIQQHDEELDRSLKISRTNTMTSTEFTNSATDRANKLMAFDSAGEIAVTQELGTFKGNWAASTAYTVRDLVKDTSTNNIFIVNEAHTSSGSQPLTTNANSAKYTLIVDAASATTSQTAAATSATAAASSATAAATSATAAASSATTATTQASNASTSASTASTQASNAASSATAAANSASTAAAAALSPVSNDSSPELGGALDVLTHAIVSSSNRNIALTPNGTGVVQIDGTTGVDISQGAISIKNGGAQSYVRFYCESSNAHYAQLTAPAHADFSGNISIVLPTTAGTLALTSQLPTSGISSGNVATFTSGVADDDFLRVNGTSIEGRSASEVVSDIGAATTDEATALALALS
mgnify:CR=1 FL=1